MHVQDQQYSGNEVVSLPDVGNDQGDDGSVGK